MKRQSLDSASAYQGCTDNGLPPWEMPAKERPLSEQDWGIIVAAVLSEYWRTLSGWTLFAFFVVFVAAYAATQAWL